MLCWERKVQLPWNAEFSEFNVVFWCIFVYFTPILCSNVQNTETPTRSHVPLNQYTNDKIQVSLCCYYMTLLHVVFITCHQPLSLQRLMTNRKYETGWDDYPIIVILWCFSARRWWPTVKLYQMWHVRYKYTIWSSCIYIIAYTNKTSPSPSGNDVDGEQQPWQQHLSVAASAPSTHLKVPKHCAFLLLFLVQ